MSAEEMLSREFGTLAEVIHEQARERAGHPALIGPERQRARKLGLGYAAAVGVPAAEANNPSIATRVLDMLPGYLAQESVVAVGEIGLEQGTEAEERTFVRQVRLARQANLPVIVAAPTRDRREGLLRTISLLLEEGIPANHVLINGVAVAVFAYGADVDWAAAAILAVGSLAGGRFGAGYARKLGADTLRRAVVVFGLLLYGVLALALLGLVAGLGQALAKFSLDATIQRDVPHRVQASAFARSDTTLQLAWVIGGFVGIAMPLDPARLGLAVATAVLAAWTVWVIGRRRGLLIRPATADRAESA